MGAKTRTPSQVRKAEWDALCREAYEARTLISDGAKQELLAVIDRVCDIGDNHQVAPRIMAAIMAGIIGQLSLVEAGGNVHADEHFDAFVDYCHAAVHVAVAAVRLNSGWTPGGPN